MTTVEIKTKQKLFTCLLDAAVFSKVKMLRVVNDGPGIWDDMPQLMHEDASYDINHERDGVPRSISPMRY